MNQNLSSTYLSKNFLEIVKRKYPLASTNAIAKTFMADLKSQPLRSVASFISQYNPKVVYPALVIANDLKRECIIQKSIEVIESELVKTPLINGVNASVFFVFLPVVDASAIKQEVLDWIKTKKPLI